jgi:hypothetical protein
MDLRALFLRALKTTSVIAPLALSGCTPDTTGSTQVDCDEGSFPSVRGLQPSVIPDVLALRAVRTLGGEPRGAPATLSSAGTACATATDAGVCQSSYDALAPASGFAASCRQLCSDYHLAITRGDEVRAIASLDELKAFLAPIDTAQEALLIAFAHGYGFDCTRIDRGAAKATGSGWDVIATSGSTCGPGTAYVRNYLSVTAEGALTEQRNEVIEYGNPNCAIGRRPPGLRTSGRSDCADALGRFFAEAAHLEAASVPAFERLVDELTALGAPVALVERARLAALEEIDHARTTAALARRFEARVEAPSLSDHPLRTRVALALDNAREGCVRETFGALVANYQALHAGDAELRQALEGIAVDETRHAELSWAMAGWLEAGLSAGERARVRRARRDALAQLERELDAPVDPVLVAEAGLPPPHVAQALLSSIREQLDAEPWWITPEESRAAGP